MSSMSWPLFDQGQGHGMTSKFFPFTKMQIVRSYISALAHGRKLLLSICVHLILLYKIYEYPYA